MAVIPSLHFRNFQEINWSFHATTCAAQKLPENVHEILTEAALREAYCIHTYDIPAALRINTDQTQTIYQQGTNATWNQKGDCQLLPWEPSISASGELLPFQAIYQGATPASCPNHESPFYNEAQRLGFRDKYWSTMAIMKSLVNEIIAPYFAHKKDELEIEDLDNQFSIWKIDCWSVHKSKEFLSWMETTHPKIIIIFVLGNCMYACS
ncbi:hypothetical protein BT96DRAFT_961067 [Gymnopus androsaceus JB14]|uniref:DDE-1 domain-containing protein n=1 Tax=Gymnopus androsaceus JB14 TaxID=1447944 RepID=A0A6A4GD29_9AGAR|nr:hypothetical protein BT96DRAFT_961067 [Gymnopus androsaceus JB14]